MYIPKDQTTEDVKLDIDSYYYKFTKSYNEKYDINQKLVTTFYDKEIFKNKCEGIIDDSQGAQKLEDLNFTIKTVDRTSLYNDFNSVYTIDVNTDALENTLVAETNPIKKKIISK